MTWPWPRRCCAPLRARPLPPSTSCADATLRRYLEKERPALCVIDLGLPDGRRPWTWCAACRASTMWAVVILTRPRRGGRLGSSGSNWEPTTMWSSRSSRGSWLRGFGRSCGGSRRNRAMRRSSSRSRRGGRLGFTAGPFNPDSFSLIGPTGEEVAMSAAEAALLSVLLRAPNRVLSRDQLLEMASGSAPGTVRPQYRRAYFALAAEARG